MSLDHWVILALGGACIFGLVVGSRHYFRLKSEASGLKAKLDFMEASKAELKEAFRGLSAEALSQNTDAFLRIAEQNFSKLREASKEDLDRRKESIEHLIKPLSESLSKVDHKIHELDRQREGAYQGLLAQIQAMSEDQRRLRGETARLVKALRRPDARGRWGEIQLKRVVEMAGMLSHCDFTEQTSTQSDEGLRRPDMVVHLPGEKHIVVDAKAVLSAYLDSLDCESEDQRLEKLRDHASQIRKQVTLLSQKSYWSQFENSPEFVVLFLPGEVFFSAALEQDPGLIEAGVAQKVIIATPTTLIALLRAVSFGWRQEAMADNARRVGELGKELHGRIADLTAHVSDLGRHIKGAVTSYNRAVGNLESRVSVSARKFADLKVEDPKKTIKPLSGLDVLPRELTSSSDGSST